jgi:N-acetylglucosaminyl-diphospho-decaprenol L-rhamnosyltransferase
MKSLRNISISIVSHTQIALVKPLLLDLNRYCETSSVEVILTLNIPESLPFNLDDFSYPIVLLVNSVPKGFGANHNTAFAHARGRYFCVLNPDIRISSNPFDELLANFTDHSIGVAAPLVMDGEGQVEDSARNFPTPLTILCKALGYCNGNDYVIGEEPFYPDWVGGMCMLFSRASFQRLGGFDERFFLYYEDVDICARSWLLGLKVMVNPQSKITHYAQRTSRYRLKYLGWHLKSMIRFFFSSICWRVQLYRRR